MHIPKKWESAIPVLGVPTVVQSWKNIIASWLYVSFPPHEWVQFLHRRPHSTSYLFIFHFGSFEYLQDCGYSVWNYACFRLLKEVLTPISITLLLNPHTYTFSPHPQSNSQASKTFIMQTSKLILLLFSWLFISCLDSGWEWTSRHIKKSDQ